ncbi:putative tpr domain-containing protein [Phaeoacremonium minimum UCRPA7]|uniref:Putative tpr domain-containing protein n=1 Tax=Phaeoacremonium minimum (strain UCR-PA7) TaxID=1286976 RepID=R8BIY4_PHAM7|nr:putative tpr domain-containing protein [Phaeoacremonium minimum UCRPA7]EON99288.1 putative tpr domain-containing protein [Phaeoacremonium minimum UCRPA7]
MFGGSFRNLLSTFRGQRLKAVFRQNPEELVLALVILAACVGIIVYAVRLYFTYFYSQQFTRYPAPVAKSLRRALYYSNYSPDHKLALKYYKLALEQCDELRLDPFSDEVMGIKIQLAAWLERIENYEGAITVLEALLKDCKKWVDVMETSVKEGTLAKTNASLLPPSGLRDDPDKEPAAPETLWGKRTRVLAKSVGIGVKLGELYADEHVLEQNKAHKNLTWAVETALKEYQRRTVDGLKEGEGPWMSAEDMGGALELNNLAASFAQHPLQAPYETLVGILPGTETDDASSPPAPQKQTRAELLGSARRWAKNAYQHAKEPTGDQRTPECDEACAVALNNLGDIAAMTGKAEEARKKYEQSSKLSQKIGFTDGVKQAEAGLRRLTM